MGESGRPPGHAAVQTPSLSRAERTCSTASWFDMPRPSRRSVAAERTWPTITLTERLEVSSSAAVALAAARSADSRVADRTGAPPR